ncbi:hypothetical protein EVAR_17815_1 [Eumeta japonica]|uniref:RRM domain-containing protein n=1 Tax=Eumeta variegata TaxID=151549 RepID=A0A4C1TTV2_EUMVA|nr:hypothetical protein EVAR_17815_1 [Eumeta japonica]
MEAGGIVRPRAGPPHWPATCAPESIGWANFSALEEDNSAFHMGRMRVRRPLPPTETTLIAKCHSPLDESILSSTFLSCGRIRSIRKVEKSKKSISSAFIEFNGPKEVEKAIKLSSTLRIGGKKVYVAKFEIRNKKHDGEQADAIKDEVNEES